MRVPHHSLDSITLISTMTDPIPDYFPDDLPLFEVGQIVVHRRYGYRGVVVDFDMACQASDAWYSNNRTQPSRDQPWYHVLVDESDVNTYVAQENLLPDESAVPVRHPLVEHFFAAFDEARYQRNDRTWPT
jgi:heat shock protein HspQ